MMSEAPNTHCENCGYEWKYSGFGEPKSVATCPDCGSKTPTMNMRECYDCEERFHVDEVDRDTLGCPNCDSQNWGDVDGE